MNKAIIFYGIRTTSPAQPSVHMLAQALDLSSNPYKISVTYFGMRPIHMANNTILRVFAPPILTSSSPPHFSTISRMSHDGFLFLWCRYLMPTQVAANSPARLQSPCVRSRKCMASWAQRLGEQLLANNRFRSHTKAETREGKDGVTAQRPLPFFYRMLLCSTPSACLFLLLMQREFMSCLALGSSKALEDIGKATLGRQENGTPFNDYREDRESRCSSCLPIIRRYARHRSSRMSTTNKAEAVCDHLSLSRSSSFS